MSSTSQSVARTVALFQTFAREKRALNAAEIARAISAPRSSCAALLKTLVDLSMLSIDRRTSSYFPTTRFAELGAWISDGSIYPDSLIPLLHDLQMITGETITLGAVQDLTIELVRVERSKQAISFTAEKGQTFTVWGSSLGHAFLSTMDNQQIRALYRRAEDRRLVDTGKHPLESVLAQVQETRERGYAVLEGAVFADSTAISIATGITVGKRPLIIAIAGPTNRMTEKLDAFGRLLLREVERLRAGGSKPV